MVYLGVAKSDYDFLDKLNVKYMEHLNLNHSICQIAKPTKQTNKQTNVHLIQWIVCIFIGISNTVSFLCIVVDCYRGPFAS